MFLNNVENGVGNVYACLLGLRSLAEASALLAWFPGHDLSLFKQWCYVQAKLSRMLFQRRPDEWFPAYLLLMPLLSDNEEVVSWFAHFERPFDLVRADDIATPEFHGYQALLAIRGQWELLEERCSRIFNKSTGNMKKYEIDHRFYIALAKGNLAEMESVLGELTSQSVARVRNIETAFGFSGKFISTHAVIYAKIAWRHGYPIKIDTPFIPLEWLPVSPLPAYNDPYDFMKKFDINAPIE